MQSKIDLHGLDWQVDSAGTSGHHNGDRPDARSIDVASKHGIDISHQKSRQLIASDLENYDLICVMDSTNYINTRMLSRNSAHHQKIHLIMNFVEPGRNVNVTDPYYGDEGFDRVYELLDEACSAIINKYQN